MRITAARPRTRARITAYGDAWSARYAIRDSLAGPRAGPVRFRVTCARVSPGYPGSVRFPVTVRITGQSVPGWHCEHSDQRKHMSPRSPAERVFAGQRHNRGQSQSVRGQRLSPIPIDLR